MTDQSPFEARLTDAYARYVAAVPVEVDALAVAATATAGSAARPLGWRGVTVPSRRTWVLLAIGLLAIAMGAAALLAGSRPSRHLASGGLLVYVRDHDIYLADEDGSNPRKVADGVAWNNGAGGGPSYLLGDGGPAWSPDGRYFLYYDVRGASGLGTGHIADASGHVLASIPNIWVDATWSPDSTRIEAWTGGPDPGFGTTQISIFGVDGALQESLALPAGYIRSRESAGWWTPDGRSVRVRLAQGDGGPPASYWQLALDGSAPRRLRPVELVPRSISPDGSRMAWSSAGTLFVANADGTDAHADAVISPNASGPIWSPTGTQVAYDADTGNSTREIHVVDIASGTDRIVVPNVQVNGPGLRGWSRAGDRLLFAGIDQQGPSLWSISADGTDREVVVAGADDGEWQPAPGPHPSPAARGSGWIAAVTPKEDGSPGSNISLVRPGAPFHVIAGGQEIDRVHRGCPSFSGDGTQLAYGEASLAGGNPQDAALVIQGVAADGTVSAPWTYPVTATVGGSAGYAPPCAVWAPGRPSSFAFVNATPDPDDPVGFTGTVITVGTLSGGRITIDIGARVLDLSWSPGGDALAVSTPDGIELVQPQDDGPPQLLAGTQGAGQLDWSPDGERIAYQRSAGSGGDKVDLVVRTLSTDQDSVVAAGYAVNDGIGPMWSPTGDALLYQRVSAGGREEQDAVVLTLRQGQSTWTADGVSERVLAWPMIDGSSWSPFWTTWSPDGSALLEFAWRIFGTQVGLIVVPLVAGSAPVLLAEYQPDSGADALPVIGLQIGVSSGVPGVSPTTWGRVP